jgi:hypothetical protein
MRRYPYAFHIALDGNGINGIEGRAGVCLFLYDPADESYAYKIMYYDGAAAGHAVSVNPGGTVGFLGNAAQHILLYDAATLTELDRISTLRFESADTSIRGSTHAVWLDDETFITAMGDHFYRVPTNDLAHPELLGPHGVKLPHGMKLSASGRYICYGSMDHPARGEAKEVGIWDVETGNVRRVALPATCWHLVVDPHRDVFYSVSFRVLPQAGGDYHQWAIAFFKEYAFEIDAPSGQVLRHWSAGREIPAHINSDVTLSDQELIFCNGASHTVVLIDRRTFAGFRIIDENPGWVTGLLAGRQVMTQVYDSLARGSFFTHAHDILAAARVNRFALVDSLHACQLSSDQTLLFTANRGLNWITIYDYPSTDIRLRVILPELQQFIPTMSPFADPRLGLHHGQLISAAPA